MDARWLLYIGIVACYNVLMDIIISERRASRIPPFENGGILDAFFMNIFVIRHGQCLSNIDGGLSYTTDEADGLTELGRQQALATGTALRSLWKEEIILLSSPLRRARETAEIIAEQIGTSNPIIFDVRLVEQRFESLTETFDAAAERAWAAIEEHCVFVLTHGHVLQALVAQSFGLSDPMIVNPINCGISYFCDKQLISLNMAMHLVGLLENTPVIQFNLKQGGS